MDVLRVGQKCDWDCGLACVRASIRAFGMVPCGLVNVLKPHPTHGTSPDRIAACFAGHGLSVRRREEMSWTELRHATTRGVVLAPIQLHGEGHWVIVKSATAKGVELMDPAPEPIERMTRWDFMAAWRDEYPAGVWLDRFALEVSRESRASRLSIAA